VTQESGHFYRTPTASLGRSEAGRLRILALIAGAGAIWAGILVFAFAFFFVQERVRELPRVVLILGVLPAGAAGGFLAASIAGSRQRLHAAIAGAIASLPLGLLALLTGQRSVNRLSLLFACAVPVIVITSCAVLGGWIAQRRARAVDRRVAQTEA
jgi:hypothetical protein